MLLKFNMSLTISVRLREICGLAMESHGINCKLTWYNTTGRWTRVALVLGCLIGCSPIDAEQTMIPDYRSAKRVFWSKLYAQGGETIYCGQRFGSSKGRNINVEHIFPMSWIGKELRCGERSECRGRSARFNRIEADLHNLYPSRADINEERSSFAFGEIGGERRRFGQCDFEIDYRKRRAEPREARRGEIARAMFYMHETYGLILFKRAGILLKRWNKQDPPSREEHRRNDLIAKLQGTRNRFIDDPSAADDLWF